MSTQHHDSRRSANDAITRFLSEAREGHGEPNQREYPNGRLNADDDGEFAFALATDDRKRVIIMSFPHPTAWIGLDVASAERLRDNLTERLLALKGVTP